MATQPSNLTMHREGPNVWDRQARQNSQCRAMGVIGLLMIAGGTCLVAQAYKKQLSSAMKFRAGQLAEKWRGDPVNTESRDSFPASDPPSWTPAVGKPSEAENRPQ